jgi:hypothetical protein
LSVDSITNQLTETRANKRAAGELLRVILNAETTLKSAESNEDDFVQILDALLTGSSNLSLPELQSKAEALASATIEKNPSHCAAFLAECESHGALKSSFTERFALHKIRWKPKELLFDSGAFSLLSTARMEEIVKDKGLCFREASGGEWSDYSGGYSDNWFKTDVLQCPVLTSGVLNWSIHAKAFRRGLDEVALGVVSTMHDHNFSSYLGSRSQASEWSYRQDGYACHNSSCSPGHPGHPKFKKGSELKRARE